MLKFYTNRYDVYGVKKVLFAKKIIFIAICSIRSLLQ